MIHQGIMENVKRKFENNDLFTITNIIASRRRDMKFAKEKIKSR